MFGRFLHIFNAFQHDEMQIYFSLAKILDEKSEEGLTLLGTSETVVNVPLEKCLNQLKKFEEKLPK